MEHLEISHIKKPHSKKSRSYKPSSQDSEKSKSSFSNTLSSGLIRIRSPRGAKKAKVVENRDSMNAYPPQFEFEDIGRGNFFQQSIKSAQNRLRSLNSSASSFSNFRRNRLDFDEESKNIDIVEENSNIELAHSEVDRQNTESRAIPGEDIEGQIQRENIPLDESAMVEQAIRDVRLKRIKSQLNMLLIYLLAYAIESFIIIFRVSDPDPVVEYTLFVPLMLTIFRIVKFIIEFKNSIVDEQLIKNGLEITF